jgi:uncharacterized protein (TIGR02453 family)
MPTRRRPAPAKSSSTESPYFPQEGIRFLRALKQNNDRDWFRERKDDYAKSVEEPMKRIILAVAAECRARGLTLFAKDKHPVMRVYRDIRFSKDKRPFKTHVGAELRRSFNETSWGGLYLHISPDDSFIASGFWEPERSTLLAWREKIIRDSAGFDKMHRALLKESLDFSSEYVLSAMPRGFANYAESPIARWLKLTSFVVSRRLHPAECTAPSCVDAIVRFALASRPLLEFGWQIEAAKAPAKTTAALEDFF